MKHGTVSMYNNRGCRCDECRAAKIAWNTAWRHRRSPPKPKVPALSRRDHARLYRAMLRRGEWEQGVHKRRVTILRKYDARLAQQLHDKHTQKPAAIAVMEERS